MAKLKLLYEADWDYSLYQGKDVFIVSVVCDSGDIDELNIPISEADADAIQQGSTELVERIRQSPAKYAARHVEIRQGDLE
jgi:hypothetical protein